MEKLLFIPQNFQHNSQPDLHKSFCKYYDVHYYRNQEDALAFNAGIIYAQAWALDVDLMKELKEKSGAFLVQWTGDCREEILPDVLKYKDLADLTLLASGIHQKEMYEAVLNHPVGYWQHGLSDFQFKDVQMEQAEKKVVFVGNNYDNFSGAVERTQLCELLSSKFKEFEVVGNGYSDPKYNNTRSINFYDTPQLYNSSYIGIAANSFHHMEGYWSCRNMDIMAAGTCCLMRYVPNLEKYFTDMKHCIYYYNNDEVVEKIRFILDNPELRNKIAVQGQEWVRQYHTYDYRVLELKRMINEFKK